MSHRNVWTAFVLIGLAVGTVSILQPEVSDGQAAAFAGSFGTFGILFALVGALAVISAAVAVIPGGN